MKKRLLALLAASFCITNVNAVTIEQLPSGGGNGTFTNDNTWGAEDFTLTESLSIETLSFWAQSNNSGATPPGDSADWRIYSDNSNLPNALLSSGTVSTGNGSYSRTLVNSGSPFSDYKYTLDIVDFVLGAGSYWLAFSPKPEFDATNPVKGPHWILSNTGNGISALSTDGGINWANDYALGTDNSFNWSYSIEASAVPVPAAVWLFGSALIGLVSFRRKSN